MDATNLIYVAMAIIVYLILVNANRQSPSKDRNALILSIVLLNSIVLSFLLLGWKMGLLSVLGCFGLAFLLRPYALKTTDWLAVRYPAKKDSARATTE